MSHLKTIASSITENTIYWAPRNEKFKEMIKKVLKMSEIRKKYIDILTDDESLKTYSLVFTHKSADPVNNYEFYEILGDATLNKIIPWYIIRRFPQLKNPEFVTIIARLKINLASKKSFSAIAAKLGLWEFISADTLTRSSEMKKTLEDVFEAFFGATELLLEERCAIEMNIDPKIVQGIGSIAMSKLGEKLFDEEKIRLTYNDLVDAKTRLKELTDAKNKKDMFNDHQKHLLSTLKYESVKNGLLTTTRVICHENHVLGTGVASLKTDSEQIAAEHALSSLRSMGISREVPQIYQKLESMNNVVVVVTNKKKSCC